MIIWQNLSRCRELIARIKALFRRQQAMGQAQTDGIIQAHGLRLSIAGAHCTLTVNTSISPARI